MAQVGLRDTNDIDSNRLFIDVADDIADLQREKGPLSLLTRKASSKGTKKPKYGHYEGGLRALTVATTASATSGDTTLSLSDADTDNVVVDTMIHVPSTGEVMRVTAVDNAADTIDVTRAVGSTSAVAISSAATLVLIGTAHQEGSGSPTEVNSSNQWISNYTQIFKDTFSVTGTLSSTVLEAGSPEFDRLSNQKSLEHVRGIEFAYLFGRKSEDLSGAEPRRTTGGLDEHISTNVHNLSGSAITAKLLDQYAEQFMQYGASRKFILAGSNFIRCIQDIARGDLQVTQGEDTYGLNVSRLVTGFGTLDIVYHEVMSQYGYNDLAFVIDPDSIQKRTLNNNGENRNNVLQMNIQGNDQDKMKSQYLSEIGFEVFNEEKLAKIENVGTP